MNVTEKIMSKKYFIPLCTVIDADAQQIICGSNDLRMGYSNTVKATHHSEDPDEDVLVKQQSNWDTEW